MSDDTVETRGMYQTIMRLTQECVDLRAKLAAAEEALEFYADPDTYFAISFLSDPPCGEFMDDFGDVPFAGAYDRPMPGHRARVVLGIPTTEEELAALAAGEGK